MLKPWRKLSSKRLGFYKIFHLREDQYESPEDAHSTAFMYWRRRNGLTLCR